MSPLNLSGPIRLMYRSQCLTPPNWSKCPAVDWQGALLDQGTSRRRLQPGLEEVEEGVWLLCASHNRHWAWPEGGNGGTRCWTESLLLCASLRRHRALS